LTIHELEQVEGADSPIEFTDELRSCFIALLMQTSVVEFMKPLKEVPVLQSAQTIGEAIKTINNKSAETTSLDHPTSWGYGFILDDKSQRIVTDVFTERDLFDQIVKIASFPDSANDLSFNRSIVTVAKLYPQTISGSATLLEAIQLMCQKNFRRLPVVDDQGNIIGAISERTLYNQIKDSFPNGITSGPERPANWSFSDAR
jgi:CBS domain-containing protein